MGWDSEGHRSRSGESYRNLRTRPAQLPIPAMDAPGVGVGGVNLEADQSGTRGYNASQDGHVGVGIDDAGDLRGGGRNPIPKQRAHGPPRSTFGFTGN